MTASRQLRPLFGNDATSVSITTSHTARSGRRCTRDSRRSARMRRTPRPPPRCRSLAPADHRPSGVLCGCQLIEGPALPGRSQLRGRLLVVEPEGQERGAYGLRRRESEDGVAALVDDCSDRGKIGDDQATEVWAACRSHVPSDEHARACRPRRGEELRELLVSRDKQTLLGTATLEDLLVSGTLKPDIPGVDNVVAGLMEYCDECGREVLVDQDSQADSCSGMYTSFRASAAA